MSTAAEPAIKSYYFGKGYRDLGSTIADSWRLNLDAAQIHFREAVALFPGEIADKAKGVVLLTAGVSVVVFGSIFFVVASTVHITVLLIFFSLIYLSFSLLYLCERAFLLGKRYFTVCPHCHERYPLPEYFCPGCGAVHRRLIPSSYGILHRTCSCGEKLPASFFLNRGKLLKARCANPECHQLLETSHLESQKLFVPIVGGPSVGKSAFLFSAVRELIDDRAVQLGLTTAFVESRSEGDFERVQRQLDQGQPPDKTLDNLPKAFNLELQGRGSPRLLYLYDPAGEAYSATTDLVLHRFQGYLSGMVFLIDPFSIPAVRDEIGDQLTTVTGDLKPSMLPIEDALARVLISMEEHFGLSKTSRVKKPVAVVLNKIDAFDLEDRLGERAIAHRVAAAAQPTDHDKARSELIREHLLRWDQADLVQQLEARFSKVSYFACSSLGRMPDGTTRAFESRGVMEPLLWILGDSDRVFR